MLAEKLFGRFRRKGQSSRKAGAPAGVDPRLQGLHRREVWLWATTLTGTLLTAGAFVLLSVPSLFRPQGLLFSLDSEPTLRGLTAFVLLLYSSAAYRQWQLRRMRKEILEQGTGATAGTASPGRGEVDTLTGLSTRAFAEQWLTKQLAVARRDGKPVTLLAVGLDGLDQVREQFGTPYVDQALREVTQRLKKASRGSDLPVRLGATEFLLALPECPLAAGKIVADRLTPVEVKRAAESRTVTCTTAWVDYEPGQSASTLLDRAQQMLKLYE